MAGSIRAGTGGAGAMRPWGRAVWWAILRHAQRCSQCQGDEVCRRGRALLALLAMATRDPWNDVDGSATHG